MKPKISLAIIFGGQSVEHEVSIITACQLMENINQDKYEIIPIYIAKNGEWLVSNRLPKIKDFRDPEEVKNILSECYLFRHKGQVFLKTIGGLFSKEIKIEVFFPVIHGTFGEDGTLQGLLEMLGAPYVGSGVVGSAVGMDKVMQKDIFRANGLPAVDYVWFLREEWIRSQNELVKTIERRLQYPLFIKPVNLGSSIAVSRADNRRQLTTAVELAANFDRRIMVEQGIEDIIEINCSILGYKKLEASVCEQPIKSGELLSYEDKYIKGGKAKGMASLSRLIPAPIPKRLTLEIQETAKKAFRAADAGGVARIDFLVDIKKQKFWVCEINTLPGSLAFYLWEKSGYPFPKLVDKLVELARERFNDRKATNYSFESNLLAMAGKGAKA